MEGQEAGTGRGRKEAGAGGGGGQRSGRGPELQGQGEGLGGFHDSGLGAAPRYQEGLPRCALSMADPPRAHWERRQDEARGCRGRLTGGPAPSTAKARVRRSWKEPATAGILEQAPGMIHRGPRRAGLPRAGARGRCRRGPGPTAQKQAHSLPHHGVLKGVGPTENLGGCTRRVRAQDTQGLLPIGPRPFLASLTPIQSVFLKRVF